MSRPFLRWTLSRGHERLPHNRGSRPRQSPVSWAGVLLASLVLTLSGTAQAETGRVLRICADPNNLPSSNARLEGFENRLAELLAEELDAELDYTWWAQRRGFLRNTLLAGRCDLVMGVPAEQEQLRTTRPYYRSVYTFVYPAAHAKLSSFDDPALRTLRIGLHLIGDDGSNTPPELALAARGMVDNVAGYMIQGDYAEENPPARLVEAVASGEVDVAAVWGPLAGYFAPRQPVPLAVTPITPAVRPFAFAISMGVRPDDEALAAELDGILQRRQGEVERILREYGVPLLPLWNDADEGSHD